MNKYKFIFFLIIYVIVNFIIYSITADNRIAFIIYKVLRVVSMPVIILYGYKWCSTDKD